MNLKILTEERAKLLKDFREYIKGSSFDKERADKMFEDIQKKDTEIKLAKQEDEDFARSLGSGGPIHEIRDFKTGKPISQGSHEELNDFLRRDILAGSGSGQYTVPTPLQGPLYQYIIEPSLPGRLGCQNVGVSSGTTNFAEVTALPTTSIPGEGQTLSESDPTFTQRTLTMHTYRAGTEVSLEQLEDSIDSPQHIMNPLYQSIADKISYDFINGSGSGAPLGLKNMTGVYMRLHLGANGGNLTGFEELGALWEKARNLNHSVSAFVMAPRTYKEYKQLEDANESPKANPWGEIPMVDSVHVLTNETEGTSTNCSRIYAGSYKNNVVLGWRYGAPDSIKFLVDRNTRAEDAVVRIYAYCRVGIMHPRGTGVFGFAKGVTPPSGAIT